MKIEPVEKLNFIKIMLKMNNYYDLKSAFIDNVDIFSFIIAIISIAVIIVYCIKLKNKKDTDENGLKELKKRRNYAITTLVYSIIVYYLFIKSYKKPIPKSFYMGDYFGSIFARIILSPAMIIAFVKYIDGIIKYRKSTLEDEKKELKKSNIVSFLILVITFLFIILLYRIYYHSFYYKIGNSCNTLMIYAFLAHLFIKVLNSVDFKKSVSKDEKTEKKDISDKELYYNLAIAFCTVVIIQVFVQLIIGLPIWWQILPS